MFALAQYGNPAQAGLRPFQTEKLKQQAIVVLSHTPLKIMVSLVKFIVTTPPATPDFVG
jgi:hypothetical protein